MVNIKAKVNRAFNSSMEVCVAGPAGGGMALPFHSTQDPSPCRALTRVPKWLAGEGGLEGFLCYHPIVLEDSWRPGRGAGLLTASTGQAHSVAGREGLGRAVPYLVMVLQWESPGFCLLAHLSGLCPHICTMGPWLLLSGH